MPINQATKCLKVDINLHVTNITAMSPPQRSTLSIITSYKGVSELKLQMLCALHLVICLLNSNFKSDENTQDALRLGRTEIAGLQ